MKVSIKTFGRRKKRPGINRKTFTSCLSNYARRLSLQSITLNYIYVNDEELLSMNQTYLDHDTYTDIITFDLSEHKDEIMGEIYISLDRITENATKYNTTAKEEFLRVMFHGFLHLCGHKDKTQAEQKLMRAAEDECLNLYRQREKQAV